METSFILPTPHQNYATLESFHQLEIEKPGLGHKQECAYRFHLKGLGFLGVAALFGASVFAFSNRNSHWNAEKIVFDLQPSFNHVKSDFQEYCIHHNKKYNVTEFEIRATHFHNNILEREKLRKMEIVRGGTAVHGNSKYMDWDLNTMTASLKGIRIPEGYRLIHRIKTQNSSKTIRDWTGKLTTGIKDQGYCGCCWAVVASEQLESDSMRLGLPNFNPNTLLAPEELVDCDTYDYGCGGGFYISAYQFIYDNNYGMGLNAGYPFTASVTNQAAHCTYNPKSSLLTLAFNTSTSSFAVGFATERDMANFVLDHGPVSAMIDSSPFSTYMYGVIASCNPVNYTIDHAVQIVGVNLDLQYWIVRNSWGTGFGMQGFAFMQYGSNMCGLLDYAHYTVPALYSNVTSPSPTSTPSKVPSTYPTSRPSKSPTKRPSQLPFSRPTSKPY